MASKREEDFQSWLFSEIEREGFIKKDDAINSGAYIVNCSVVTTKKYLDKLTSREGPLKIVLGNRAWVVVPNNFNINFDVNQGV